MNRKIIGVTVGTPINPNKFAPSDALRIDKTATDKKGLLIGQKGSALAEVITLGEGLKIEDGKLEINIPIYGGEMGDVDSIRFTIEGVTYTAKDGMTWEEWIESEYNTDGYYMGENDFVYSTDGSRVYSPGGMNTNAFEIITDGTAYSCY